MVSGARGDPHVVWLGRVVGGGFPSRLRSCELAQMIVVVVVVVFVVVVVVVVAVVVE